MTKIDLPSRRRIDKQQDKVVKDPTDWFFCSRPLSSINPRLVRAEKDFWEGRRWTFIKVSIKYADGSVVEGSQRLKADRVL